MARKRKNQGNLDIRIILNDELSDFLRLLTEKSFRSFQEEIRYLLKEKLESE